MLTLTRPHPYKVKPDRTIEKLPPNERLELFYAIPVMVKDAQGNMVHQTNAKGHRIYKHQTLYVNDGQIWKDEKTTISPEHVTEEYPWFWDEYSKVEPHMRRHFKLALPGENFDAANLRETIAQTPFDQLPDHIKEALLAQYAQASAHLHQEQEQEDESVKMWQCPECQEEVELKKKGVHIAGHRRSHS